MIDYERCLEQLARHRRAMLAAAALLNKTGRCNPEDAAAIGQMLYAVANAPDEAATDAAATNLERMAGHVA